MYQQKEDFPFEFISSMNEKRHYTPNDANVNFEYPEMNAVGNINLQMMSFNHNGIVGSNLKQSTS